MGEDFPHEQQFDEEQQHNPDQQPQQSEGFQEKQQSVPEYSIPVVEHDSEGHLQVEQDKEPEPGADDNGLFSSELIEDKEKAHNMAFAEKPIQDMVANVKSSTVIAEEAKQQIIDDLTVNAEALAAEAAAEYEEQETAVREETSLAVGKVLTLLAEGSNYRMSQLLKQGYSNDPYNTRYHYLDDVPQRVRDNIFAAFGFDESNKSEPEVDKTGLVSGFFGVSSKTTTIRYEKEDLPVVLEETYIGDKENVRGYDKYFKQYILRVKQKDSWQPAGNSR